MPSTNLIGTAVDQVPTNGDLGSLAFQSRESVNFLDGVGGLKSLDITEVSRQLNVTAVDLFVYDTSLDSDGGAWRNRCQHTSWYNEELNTDIRGSRREFPGVVVIVAEAGRVTIYDADDPTLPMWMTFGTDLFPYRTGGALTTSVALMNGLLVIGTGSGLSAAHFIYDELTLNQVSAGTQRRNSWVNIAARFNNGSAWLTDSSRFLVSSNSQSIINNVVNDVAITVLPSAPVDPTTGLPVPTIAVATAVGASVIRHDGTVGSYTINESVPSISINNRYESLEFGWGDAFIVLPISTATGSINYTSGIGGYNGNISTGYYPYFNSGNFSKLINTPGGFVVNHSGIFHQYEYTSGNFRSALDNIITSKYNTGWMVGDTKGCWLSDSTSETVVGTELITNGSFNTDLSSWSYPTGAGGNNTVTFSSGQLRIVRNDATSAGHSDPLQVINTIPGKTYSITHTQTLNISFNNNAIVIASSVNGTTLLDFRPTGSGTFTSYFTAIESQTRIVLAVDVNGDNVLFDNVSVRIADPDRSVNRRGLQTFGTITKTPVATGSDLVAYSGWSANNYLEQPYNSALDFGTGDFSYITWFKVSNVGGGDSFINRGGVAGLYIWVASDLKYISVNLGNLSVVTLNNSFVNDVWNQICVKRVSGTVSIFINSKLIQSDACAGNVNSGTPATIIGSLANANPHFSLMRISATAPSDAQVLKMYEDEKVLFQANSKATIYGTSDAVTALSYDPVTELLHVGTAGGRSVFQGLRRVDNTTLAVGAAISAVNNLVVDE